MATTSSGWLSYAIRWPSLLTFGTLVVALAGTIVGLMVKSSTGKGFVTIPASSLNISATVGDQRDPLQFNVSWDLGVLWTTVPSFVFALLSAYWAWIAGAISDRQPYVELRREQGANAKSSILLDYRLFPSLWRWWVAFRRSHKAVGATTLLAVLLSYIVVPFAARLFATKVVPISGAMPVTYNMTYNSSNMNADVDWRPAIDITAATLLYRATKLSWTDSQAAYRPFSVSPKIVAGTEVEANSTSNSVRLDCEFISNYTMTFGAGNPGAGVIRVSGSDRGCSFQQKFAVGQSQQVYLTTTAQVDCSFQADYSRFVFTTAKYSASSNTKIDDVHVMSCIPQYRQVNGVLKVSSLTSSPTVRSFTETGTPNTRRPANWILFERGVIGPVTVNSLAKWSTTDLGNLMLYNAQILQPSDPFTAGNLAQSIIQVFSAVYLNAVAMHGFSPSTNEVDSGIGHIPTTRLFVVVWVAYIIIFFLIVSLCSVIHIFFYVQKNPSILTEEPTGLFSAAAILDSSDLLGVASRMWREPGFDGKALERSKTMTEINRKNWVAKRDDTHDRWVIRTTQMTASKMVATDST